MPADPAPPLLTCPLCGYIFKEAQAACADCPLARRCGVSQCPHCGYPLPPESKLLAWWNRWRGRRRVREGEDGRRENGNSPPEEERCRFGPNR